MDISLRLASDDDRPFIESVFFDTQRWLIEALFGWRGDEFERSKVAKELAELDQRAKTQIVLVDGSEAGWMMVQRPGDAIDLHSIFLAPAWQNRGIGTLLIRRLIVEARAASIPLRLSTAKINPAVRLYKRLGFVVTGEDNYKVFMQVS